MPENINQGGRGKNRISGDKMGGGEQLPTLYTDFEKNTEAFATILSGIIDPISTEAQKFYDQHFSEDGPTAVTLKLGMTTLPSVSGSNQQDFTFTRPVIEFGIQIDGKKINKPQAFLNEAKLTQLALSVRFAASLVNLHESDLKLLVLDDLLVSLDLSNRMKVVEILLSETFANYQKIILTHDLGFFREFQRMTAGEKGNWCFRTLHGDASKNIVAKNNQTSLEKARNYINGHDLEEAALQLRKAAEETAKKYQKFEMNETQRPGKFHSLTEDLRAVRNHLEKDIPMSFYKRVIAGTPEAHRNKLLNSSITDLDEDTTLDQETKGKLKAQRKNLQKFLSETAWQRIETMETIDAVVHMKDRVLNPAAHWGETPLYEAELQKALTLVDRLERSLNPQQNNRTDQENHD